MRFDVVIVGAGIGGAVLALDLGRRGWRIALVERESTPPKIARPEVLWSPTITALERYGEWNAGVPPAEQGASRSHPSLVQEGTAAGRHLLSRRGRRRSAVAEAIRQRACVRLEMIEIGGEQPWLRITRDDFDAAGIDAFSTNPSMTRAILADAAMATGKVEIHRGVAVEELLRDNGRVIGVRSATRDFEARLVVGDDGGNSIVRTQLGIPITLTRFPIDFVTAMIPDWPLPPNRARVWLDLANAIPARAFIPWPDNTGIMLLPLRADVPTPASFGDLTDLKRVARPFGHAASYVADGAALIGDAVHPMTPAGGQGANASIWDAFALADVADTALRADDVSRERLLAYERVRRPINEQSVAISRLARRAFRIGRFLPLSIVIPLAMRTIDTLGWPKRSVLRTFSSTFVH